MMIGLNIGKFFLIPLVFLIVVSTATQAKTLEKSQQIDQILDTGYEELQLQPKVLVDDATFVRRSYLNIIGRIPLATEAKSFIDRKSPQKRVELIDKLMDSEGFKGKMFLYYAELLRLKSNEELHGMAMHNYLYEAAQKNKPYDELVFEMLSADGHIAENPAVSYYLRDEGMTLDNVSNTVQVFLGTQIGCAQCHDHPFEDTTQMDFYKLAAFSGGFKFRNSREKLQKLSHTGAQLAKADGVDFGKIRKEYESKPDRAKSKIDKIKKKYATPAIPVFKYYPRNELRDTEDQILKLPSDYQYNDGKAGDEVKPGVNFGTMPELNGKKQRREAFARWVTSPDNPQFTKVLANRLWAHAFGYGLVEPLDNWTDRTKVSHPKALEYVEKELKSNGYDVKQTLRMLYLTKLFQREVSLEEVEAGEVYHFSGPMLRRMKGEELYDSMMTLATGEDIKSNNPSHQMKWQNYLKNYHVVKDMNPEKLLVLGKAVTAVEKATADEKREVKILQVALTKAKKENDDKQITKLKSRLDKKYKTIKKIGVKSVTDSFKYDEEFSEPSLLELYQYTQKRNGNLKGDKQLRASEQPQPFKAGQFSRKFGSTDGEVTNNSKEYASIPQALSLLNGDRIGKVLSNEGAIAKKIKNASSNKERVELLFLSLYSRYPNEEEAKNFTPYADKYSRLRGLAKAMLNSKSFLFIQ